MKPADNDFRIEAYFDVNSFTCSLSLLIINLGTGIFNRVAVINWYSLLEALEIDEGLLSQVQVKDDSIPSTCRVDRFLQVDKS